MKIDKIITGPLEVNTYVVYDDESKEAVIIDAGGDFELIDDFLVGKNLILKELVLTHGHFDHLGATYKLQKKYNVKLYLHDADYFLYKTAIEHANMCGVSIQAPPKDVYFYNKDISVVKVGNFELEIIHTPGHSPGSVSFYNKELNVVFTGDLIFNMSVGRTDLPGSSYKELEDSILNKIYTLGDSCTIYPGHGDKTIIAREKKNNPFVRI